MKICFLIVDMQKCHLHGNLNPQKIEHACAYINYTSDLLRSKNHLIVHIRDLEDMNPENAAEYDIIPDIKQVETDQHVDKLYSNAFWETNLKDIIDKAKVDLVIVCGFAAENCVLFTWNGAIERGFSAVILQHGILSKHEQVISATYRDRDLISITALEAMVSSA